MSMLPLEGGKNMLNKHMTKEIWERIEKGIRNQESLKEIAKAVDKDPTTVSKEVLKHRKKAAETAFLFECLVQIEEAYLRIVFRFID